MVAVLKLKMNFFLWSLEECLWNLLGLGAELCRGLCDGAESKGVIGGVS